MPPKKRYLSRQQCPHCNGPARIRTTRKISPTFQEVSLFCDSDEEECGWRGVASFVFERTIVQSGKPNPAVKLPLAPPRRRAEDISPANDDETPAAAAL